MFACCFGPTIEAGIVLGYQRDDYQDHEIVLCECGDLFDKHSVYTMDIFWKCKPTRDVYIARVKFSRKRSDWPRKFLNS